MKTVALAFVALSSFGPAAAFAEDAEVRPFRIRVEDATLADLKERLARTRWPDELLTNVMIYWVTDTMPSSVRIYFESSHNQARPPSMTPFTGGGKPAPIGFALFPKEINVPPRAWVERSVGSQLIHWSEMPRGGHFAATEQPMLLAEDVRAFFRKVRAK